MLTPEQYRDREVLKLVEEAFIQFNISDPNEKRDITNTIKAQLNTAEPVSTMEEVPKASSAVYRSNIRTALIDIISHLLYIKDLENRLNQLEGMSRSIIENASKNLLNLQKSIIKSTGKIRESFIENIDSGTYKNTIVKEDKLRINYADIKMNINDISIIPFPANSHYDGVNTITSDNEQALLETGIGSDLYTATTTASSRPETYIDGSYFKGAALKITLSTENAIPAAVSAKAGSSFRIALWEGQTVDGKWEILGKDKTFGNYSFISADKDYIYNTNNISEAYESWEPTYDKYRLTLAFPDFLIENGLFTYKSVLHNIKLFKKDPLILKETGFFRSHTYGADSPIFKVGFDATYDGYTNFRIRFNREGEDIVHYVLPNSENTVKYAFYYSNTSTVAGAKHYLPFHCADVNTLAPTTDSGELLSYNIEYLHTDTMTYPYIIINGTAGEVAAGGGSGYEGYVLLDYVALKHRHIPLNDSDNITEGEMLEGLSHDMNPDLNEALLINPEVIIDRYNRLDTFTFPIKRIPWRIIGLDTFTFKWDSYTDQDTTIPDIEEIFPVGGEVIFEDDKQQFYYYNGALYTNFDLLALADSGAGSGLLVEYPSMCESVDVLIELFDTATVSNYYLDFVEAEDRIKSWSPVNWIPPIPPPNSEEAGEDEGAGGTT